MSSIDIARRKKHKLTELINQDCWIEWSPGRGDDWHWYRILGLDEGFAKIQGIANSAGHPYQDGPMWVAIDSILYIQTRKAMAESLHYEEKLIDRIG